MNILVLNSGSSSLKFQLINVENEKVLHNGHIDGIGLDTCQIKFDGKKEFIAVVNHAAGIKLILKDLGNEKIDAIGHRVVHGGDKFSSPVIITKEVMETIDELSQIAPLHNPANLAGIIACEEVMPQTPQVAIFDTAFHQTIPQEAYMYMLPYEQFEKYNIRRYGFHGTSHKYIMKKTCEILGKDKVTMISAHCGNGTSLCAIKNNKSVDTSMGFTPLEGLPMGTRSGDIDPGLLSFLATQEDMSLGQVDTMLNKQSGLFGLTGYSDMRLIIEKSNEGDKRCQLARKVLPYKMAKYMGAYYGILGKLDAIVFTAGLGENDFDMRKRVCKHLSHFGIELDIDKNEKNDLFITTKNSKIPVLVIPTNEELMIAKESFEVLKNN